MACCNVCQGPVFVPGLWVGDEPSHESEPWISNFLHFLCRHFFPLIVTLLRSILMGNLRREVIFRDREAEVGEEEEEKKHVAKEEEGRPGPLSLSLQIGLNGKRRNMFKKQKKDKQVPLSSVMISANVFFNKDFVPSSAAEMENGLQGVRSYFWFSRLNF